MSPTVAATVAAVVAFVVLHALALRRTAGLAVAGSAVAVVAAATTGAAAGLRPWNVMGTALVAAGAAAVAWVLGRSQRRRRAERAALAAYRARAAAIPRFAALAERDRLPSNCTTWQRTGSPPSSSPPRRPTGSPTRT
ncbi:hypothetical protein [Streptomyces sp. NPDC001750]|uniref:hypothetical protein n=1 Tax=Streptomyces sp. NPDC001750 TaxID=3364607 RepID=UPI0036A3329B